MNTITPAAERPTVASFLPHATPAHRSSLTRLTMVELRKLIDTRSGRWIVIVIGLAMVGTVATQLFINGVAGRTVGDFLSSSLFASSMLLPVLGILSATSEWSHRTVVTTFALVPARARVTMAKTFAVMLMALGSVLVALCASALAAVVVDVRFDSDVWTLGWSVVWHLILTQIIDALMGFAFGMLLLNSPLAIVLYYVLPTVWTVLGATVTGLTKAAEWLDTSTTFEPLSGEHLASGQWARIAASVVVWVAVPLAAGVVRVHRKDVS